MGLAADDLRRRADHRPRAGAGNVLIAAGHNMLGLSMAPATGKLVAEMLGGGETHIDPHRIRLGGFKSSRRAAESSAVAPSKLRLAAHWPSRLTSSPPPPTSPASMYCPPPVWLQWTAITFLPGFSALRPSARERHSA